MPSRPRRKPPARKPGKKVKVRKYKRQKPKPGATKPGKPDVTIKGRKYWTDIPGDNHLITRRHPTFTVKTPRGKPKVKYI